MAQGQQKKSKPATKNPAKNQRISRGIRKAPKATKNNEQLIKQKKMEKKLQAKNIQNLETQMAVKAASSGRLSIMKKVADQAKNDK
jgi:hypothetical protein